MNSKALRLCFVYVREYSRRPVNVLLLVLVPTVFVVLYSHAIGNIAGKLGGSADADGVIRSTVGWAAAFLAGVAALFQAGGARHADRRLADAGYGAGTIVVARLLSSTVLALASVAAAVTAFLIRNGTAGAGRATVGALLFALVYIAIGTLVGRMVRDDLNGSVIVIFTWILDIFTGPTMVGDSVITRFFPTHFASLVIADIPMGHAGIIGEGAAALLWSMVGLIVAALVFARGLRFAPDPPRAVQTNTNADASLALPTSVRVADTATLVATTRLGSSRTTACLNAALRDWGRNRVLWFLVVALPAVFISLAIALTPDEPTPTTLMENGVSTVHVLSLIDIHASSMAPLAVAALAGIAGMFVSLAAIDADRRLTLAGCKPWQLLTARFGVLSVVALVVTIVSLMITALQFQPRQWLPFAAMTLMLAFVYGVVGALIGPLVGRIAGVYLLFLVPFIDVGLGQSPMLNTTPPTWARFLPGYGPGQVLLDTALTDHFDQWWAVLITVTWSTALVLLCAARFRRFARPAST